MIICSTAKGTRMNEKHTHGARLVAYIGICFACCFSSSLFTNVWQTSVSFPAKHNLLDCFSPHYSSSFIFQALGSINKRECKAG
jgi:hypothetical protein